MWQVFHDFIFGPPAGLQRRLIHDYPWPHWTALLLLFTGWLFIWVLYRREAGRGSRRLIAALLRALVVTLLVAVFLYQWQVVTEVTDLPDLVVLVDDSASMIHRDVAPADANTRARMSRWEAVQGKLLGDRWLEAWSERYRLKVFRIAGDVRPVNDPLAQEAWQWEPDLLVHQTSRLGEALRSVLEQQRGRPTAAVVLFSDGIVTEGIALADVATYARRLAIPIYTVAVGDPNPSRDFAIADVLGDDAVFVGDIVRYDVRITGRVQQAESIKVSVQRKADGHVLATRTATLSPDAPPASVPLTFPADRVGEWDLVFEVQAEHPDANPGNDRAERRLAVRDEMLRVLYVQQYPSFDYRYLKQLLERGLHRGSKSQKAVQLHVALQEADAQMASIDASIIPAFPVERSELFRYDVVIFGDVDPALFPASLIENLVAFVEQRGGGLVVICGPRHTPWAYRATALSRLLPVPAEQMFPPSETRSAYRVVLTSLGQASPLTQMGTESDAAIWAGMPELFWVAQARQLRPAARPLLEAHAPDGSVWPLVAVQFLGAGKVVMLMTDESFRWAKHPDGDGYYARFWLQTLRYLSRAKLWGDTTGVELTVDRAEYQPGELVTVTARYLDERQAPAADDAVTVVIERDGGQRQSLALVRSNVQRGFFRAEWPARFPGDYRVWLASPTTTGQTANARFRVSAFAGEQARLEIDTEQLRQTAERSGGGYVMIQEADTLLDQLPAGRRVRIESLPPRPVWNSSWIAALFVALLTAEWIVRKSGGMI